MFRFTNTEHAPWYVVPADRKWYARAAITEIITRALVDMKPRWPEADFDVADMREQLAQTMSTAALKESLDGTASTVESAIESSIDVREEAIELRGDKKAAAQAKQQRKAWEADLAATLEQKKALLKSR